MLDILDSKALFEKADKLRKKRGWSYFKWAKEANVSTSAIYNWRDRKSSPTLYLLGGICDSFGITLINFLLDSNDYSNLDGEQKEMLEHWNILTPEQKEVILHFMRIMNKTKIGVVS